MKRRRGPCLTCWRTSLIAALTFATIVIGQGKPAAKESGEPFTVSTIDGVIISGTYFAPANPSEDTPVVILLHMFGKNQRDWFSFAQHLAGNDIAAVTFDFRGHGSSKAVDEEVYKKATRSGRAVSQISVDDDFKKGEDFLPMVRDIEAVKQLLIRKNNKKECNIRRLGLVAAGDMACAVAMLWAQTVEFRGPAKVGWTRAGGDLSCAVLITPALAFKGTFKTPTQFTPQAGQELPILLVSTNVKKEMEDASRLARQLRIRDLGELNASKKKDGAKGKAEENHNPRQEEYYRKKSGWVRVDLKDFVKGGQNKTVFGTELMRAKELGVDVTVYDYLYNRLVSDQRLVRWELREVENDEGSGFGTIR